MAGELILIVEDNEKNRKLERDILQFHGFRTVEADTAEEGIRLAQATPPALVLIDIQLPGMNGIETRPAREQADELRRPPGPRTSERRRPIEDQPRPWT
jgi:CheY-like chemotaxis protein